MIKFTSTSVLLFVFCLYPILASAQKTKSKQATYPLEFGVHFGNHVISGDVDHSLFPGYGLGLHLRKSFNNSFSLRTEFFYGKTTGLDPQLSDLRLLNEQEVFSGYGTENPWFFAYQTTIARISLQGVIELTNFGTQNMLKNYNIYLYGGIGLNSPGTKLNLRDNNDQIYTNLKERTSYNNLNDFNTNEGRREIKKALNSIYDNTYETNGFKKKGIFRLGNETNIFPEASIGFGISRRISSKINVSIDHQTIFSDNDYLDGQKWRTDIDQTNNLDFIHYTSLRLSINLSKKTRKKEPQYWVNPWNEMSDAMDSLANLVNQYQSGLADDDGDGVINQIDEEEHSKRNCPVDTRGRTLDSDGDGIVDCEDDHPYSKYNIDEKDLVKLLNDGQKNDFLDSIAYAHSNLIQQLKTGLTTENKLGSTDFEYIYFDNNSYSIKMNELTKLSKFADVLKSNNIMCIDVVGHTDQKHTETYNFDLGLRRANAVADHLKNSFKLKGVVINIKSKGELEPRIQSETNSINNVLNRRVKISICNE